MSGARGVDEVDLGKYLAECRAMVIDEIREMVPKDSRASRVLYDLMLDYPLRDAKGLRPALCVAACRALGGPLEGALPSAAVLELYHNAFLIHDDVEDRSEKRRDALTLQRLHGVPIAVNVGDAMLAMALQPLLDNMHKLDMGRALRILETVSVMARESAEGQAIGLDWVRRARWGLTGDDHLALVDQKTGWYSFIAPVRTGATVAGAPAEHIKALEEFTGALGAAFQIQDDVLNLLARESDYGKEIAGDLWEGKHTLILLHALRSMDAGERARALEILDRPRPDTDGPARDDLAGRVPPRVAEQVRQGHPHPRRADGRRLRRAVGHLDVAAELRRELAQQRRRVDRRASDRALAHEVEQLAEEPLEPRGEAHHARGPLLRSARVSERLLEKLRVTLERREGVADLVRDHRGHRAQRRQPLLPRGAHRVVAPFRGTLRHHRP